MTTHVHAPVLRSNSEIAEQAREIHPFQFTGRVILTAIAFIFTSAGWLVGTTWFVTVFTALWTFNHIRWTGECARYGYHKGARVKVVDIKPE